MCFYCTPDERESATGRKAETGRIIMRTVTVQISAVRYEVRERTEDGAVLAVFTTIHDAVAYQQAYSLGRF